LAINVLMVVAPAAGGSPAAHALAAGPNASGCASAGPLVVFRSPQPSQPTFTAVAGQSTPLDVQITDGCGNLLDPATQTAQVSASFSSRDSVSMTHIGKGVWQGTWRPLSPGTVT